MRHLTKDLVPCVGAKKHLLKPAELCKIGEMPRIGWLSMSSIRRLSLMADLYRLRTLRRRTSACLRLVMSPIPKQLLTRF